MMRIRKIVLLGMITTLLLYGTTKADVITDNDPSAFVTKSEFEAIKNRVQGGIDAYNNNLDNAIDGAIGGYLENLNMSGILAELLEKLKLQLNDGTLLGDFKFNGEDIQTIDMGDYKITSGNDLISVIPNGYPANYLRLNANGRLIFSGDTLRMNDVNGTARDLKFANSMYGSGRYDVNIDGVKIVEKMFNAMWPVGCIVLQPEKPTWGTWTELAVSLNNRYLKINSSVAWGTTTDASVEQIGATTLTLAQIPGHTHYTNCGMTGNSGSSPNIPGWRNDKNVKTFYTEYAGGGGSHSHGLSSLNPKSYGVRLWKRTA